MREILNYLRESIDENATIQEWDAKRHLNLQLAGSYEFFLISVLAEEFLAIKPIDELVIPKTKVHIQKICEEVNYEVAVLLYAPSPYQIKKMLGERIAFLAIDKQMYLPFLALHMKKSHSKLVEYSVGEKFTAATQLVYLSILYSDKTVFETEELAKNLNVSVMTVLRAMERLRQMRVIMQEISGQTNRKKIYHVTDKKEFYRIGKEYLINPAKKSWYVNQIPDTVKIYRAGLTALSEQTMLGEPLIEVYAVNASPDVFAGYRVTREQALAEGLPEIQFMRYDIGKLSNNQYIDPVSLICSLDKIDDRIEIAVQELMEGIEWYEA